MENAYLSKLNEQVNQSIVSKSMSLPAGVIPTENSANEPEI